MERKRGIFSFNVNEIEIYKHNENIKKDYITIPKASTTISHQIRISIMYN